MTTYAVIGAGLIGAATAWQLSRRGHRVVLLEAAMPGHEGGSSHGSARIFRHTYPDAFYASLVGEARHDWDDLERQAGMPLISATDALDFGELRDVPRLAEVCAQVGVPHEVLPAGAARDRWPQIAFDTEVLWHGGAGVIDAGETVATLARLALDAGAELWTDWPVARVTEHGRGYLLRTPIGRELVADHVVVAVGGWLPAVLPGLPVPDGFRAAMPPFVVRQEQTFHFPYRERGAFPALIHKSPAIRTYGLPGGQDAGFTGLKLAEYAGGRVVRDAAHADRRVDRANRDRVTEYAKRYLPGVVPMPYAESTCLFTMTPDEGFVIDRAGGITIVSACSGHGAKFTPLLGRLAADIATGTQGPARFRVAAASPGTALAG